MLPADEFELNLPTEAPSEAEKHRRHLAFFGGNFAKDAPEGTSPHDNIGLYNERHASHKQCVATISTSAKDHTWLSDDWIDEISTWEQLPSAVHGATIITANSEGTKTELVYGLD